MASESGTRSGLTREEIGQIADALLGTCMQPECAEDIGGVDVDCVESGDLLDDLVTYNNIERCQGCDWWFEAGALEEETLLCDDCAREAEND